MSDTASNRYDSWLIIAIGLLQGCALAGHAELRRSGFGTEYPWLALFSLSLALFIPPTAQWLVAERGRLRYWLMLAGVAAVMAAITGYIASIRGSENGFPLIEENQVLYLGGLAWAVAMVLASTAFHEPGGLRNYPLLFRMACRTLLVPAGALLFILVLYLLLMMLAALFALLDVFFFQYLPHSSWFGGPVYGAAFGFATAILLARPALVEGVRRAGTAIAAALFPLLVLIHLTFLGGLVVVGLEPLWATRHTTPLILTLLIAFVVFLNGAHEEGTNLTCLPQPIAVLARVAIVLSPAYVAICAYSLALRIDQHGWTSDRVLSACAIAFAGLVTVGYLVAGLRRPFTALPRLALPNLAALVAAFVLTLAINSPVLSPQRIAATNLESRILSGRTPPEQIDWAYLAFELGRYGREALNRLTQVQNVAQAEVIREKAAFATASQRHQLSAKHEPVATRQFAVVPAGTVLPADLERELRSAQAWRVGGCLSPCRLLALDLNGDGVEEFAVLGGGLPVFHRRNGQWEHLGKLTLPDNFSYDHRQALLARLADSEAAATAVPAEWRDLDVEGVRLRVK